MPGKSAIEQIGVERAFGTHERKAFRELIVSTRKGEAADGPSVGADTFRKGDEVVLATGTNQGTLGIFLRLRSDIHWADITERNGAIRSHPVAWLAHSASETRGSPK